MTSSAGSNAFALLSIFTVSIFVLLLLRHFLPLRSTPAYLLVPIFLALALPISAILLVPIDLSSSSRNVDEASRGIWLPQGVVLVAWRITYWLTFALTWLAESSSSGIHRSVAYAVSLGSFCLYSASTLTLGIGRLETASSIRYDPTVVIS